MSYVYSGTGDDGWLGAQLAKADSIVKAAQNTPSFAQEQYKKAAEIVKSVQKTASNVSQTAANAQAASAKVKDGLDHWTKAKPFVYVGGAVVLFLVVRKLV